MGTIEFKEVDIKLHDSCLTYVLKRLGVPPDRFKVNGSELVASIKICPLKEDYEIGDAKVIKACYYALND